ncbi:MULTISPECIES: MarR family winged helix-turn-helix transcriptional regulator [unclassified Inquilinus]|uniref:MarR family winged helix-turn-helix transcriptional regulator n=1 Tax=unclassified Inquilinus TaxID=2645927 RepID=UPI003F8EA94E
MPDTLEPHQRLAQQLCFAVYSTAHAFNRVYKPLLDRIGLTYPQYLVMLVLWERDGLAVKAIGEQLFLDSGTLTPLLKRLEAAGLVERRRSREDERVVNIHLTPAGRSLQAEVAAVGEGIGCAAELTLETAGSLRASLLKVRDSLHASAGAAE